MKHNRERRGRALGVILAVVASAFIGQHVLG